MRIDGPNGLGETCQAIHGEYQHVAHTTVLEFVQHPQPILGRLGLADPDSQALLVACEVDSDHQISGHVLDPAVNPELEKEGVHENNSVDCLEGPILPLLSLVQDGVGDPAYRLRRDLMVVDFLDVVLNVTSAHPLGIHRQDGVLETADISLPLLHDDG